MKKLLVVLLVLGLASPAMAAQWGWYGQVATHLGWYSVTEDYGGGPSMDSTISGYANEFDGETDSGMFVNMAGQSRLGARVKVTDQLSAHVEMGLTNAGLSTGDDHYNTEEVYLRGAYGKYQMGPGSLMVGKYFTPATFLLYSGMTGDVGDMGDAIMLSTCIPYAGRRAQIRYSIAGFDIALVEHVIANGTNNVLTGTDSNGADVTYADADFALPKIELAYQYNHPVFSIRPIIGYQSFTVEMNSVAGDESETITSMLYGLGVNLRLGMAKVNFSYAMSTNPGNYGIKNAASVGIMGGAPMNYLTRARMIGGDVEDATLSQAMIAVNLKFNQMVSLELGYGMNDASQALSSDNDVSLHSTLYYLNVPITVGPGMTITPEFGLLDRGTATLDEEVTYLDVPTMEMVTSDEIDTGAMSWFSVRFAVSF